MTINSVRFASVLYRDPDLENSRLEDVERNVTFKQGKALKDSFARIQKALEPYSPIISGKADITNSDYLSDDKDDKGNRQIIKTVYPRIELLIHGLEAFRQAISGPRVTSSQFDKELGVFEERVEKLVNETHNKLQEQNLAEPIEEATKIPDSE